MDKERLHIVFFSSWFPSRRRPTDGNFVQRHAEAVATLHKVTVLHIITDDQLPPGALEWEKRTERNVNILIGYIGQQSNPLLRWRDYLKAYKLGWRTLHDPDIIHLNVLFPAGIIAMHFAKKYRLPLVASEHWTGYHKENRAQTSIVKWWLHQYIAKHTQRLLPVSDDLKNSMLASGVKGTFTVIPNVVNTTVFSKAPPPSTNTPFHLLHVSTLIDKHKNVTGILKAVHSLQAANQRIVLHIVGDGDLAPHKEFAKTLGMNNEHVTFTGTQTPEGIAACMHKAHAFVLFSNYENLPCVILEAFATGTPVISSDVGGISEHFPTDFGVLIPPNDVKQLTQAIQTVMTAYDRYASRPMREYAVKHFSIESIARAFDSVYREVLVK